MLDEVGKLINQGFDVDLFCIGSPTIYGDAIGPMVGTMLLQEDLPANVKIIGDMNNPVMMNTYNDRKRELREGATVVVIDATVGADVGTWRCDDEPTFPGASLMSKIRPIGDYSIRAYTGPTVQDILRFELSAAVSLSYNITTELVDLIKNYKNKDIYRDKIITIEKA